MIPTINRCNDNVAIWVAKNPQHKPVHGFIYMDLRPNATCIRHLGTDEEFELFGSVEYFDLPRIVDSVIPAIC